MRQDNRVASKGEERLGGVGAMTRLGVSVLRVGVALLWLGALLAEAKVDPDRGPGVGSADSPLTGRLLVATPELQDPNFRHTVVYMVQHDAGGAMGVVINRVMATGPLDELLQDLDLAPEVELDGDVEVQLHYGGPVERGRGFVLHTSDYHEAATIVVDEAIALTGSIDVLRDIAVGQGPRRSLLALGYAGWGPNQLESEVASGAWFIVDADEELLFDQSVDTKWQRAIDRRGVDL